MSDRNDSKINWITCPDCGAKIGVVLSVGKGDQPSHQPQTEPSAPWPPTGVNEKLSAAGIDLTLVDVEEGEEIVTVSPKKFLGDLWGPTNEAIRTIGGGWIREGRQSRWEIRIEDLA